MTVLSGLFPARGRPAHLRRASESLLSLAANPERVELLFRFDTDDPALAGEMAAVTMLAKLYPRSRMVVILGERGAGYADLHVFFNELAAVSRGAWLLHWNDDTDMVTPGWDNLLCDAPPVCVQLLRRDECAVADPTFPATSRAFYEAMGHLSLNGHCDAWVSDVSWWAGCQVIRNDVAFHHHCLADQTARERVDDMPRFKGAEQTEARRRDIDNVKAAMVRAGQAAGSELR